MLLTPISVLRPRASWLVGLALIAPAAFGQAPTSPVLRSEPTRVIPETLNFANGLYRERRYELAAEQYELFLKQARPGADLDAADARFGLGNARLFLGKYKDARQAFEDFARFAPDHPNAPIARYRIGETAYVLNDLPVARRYLEAYTASPSGDRRYLEAAWSHLGDIAFRQNDLATAKRSYENALIGDPRGSLASRARLGLGRVQVALNEPEPALRTLRDLIAKGSPEWLDKAHLEIGRIEASSGRWPEALAAFEQAEKAAPQGPLVAEARIERAEALGRLNRREEAEDLLRPIATDPSRPLFAPAADALGSSLLARGKAAEALEVLDAAQSKVGPSPLGSLIRFHAAEAALALGRNDDARSRFLKLAEDDPKAPSADDAQLRAASIALGAKDDAGARAIAGSFLTRFPTSPIRADARLVDAQAALNLGQTQDAIKTLDTALTEDKPSPAVTQAATFYLGLAYQKTGQSEKATQVFGKLAQSPAPMAADAQYLLGQSAFDSGKFAEAIPALEKYLANKPDGEVADHALARLAQAQSETNQPDRAASTLETLAERFPRSPTLAATRSRLAEAALASGRFDQAATLFRASGQSPVPAQKARALSGLGWSLLRGGHPAEAAKAFGDLLESTPDDRLAPEAAFTRAFALTQARQTDPALTAYAQAIEKYPKAPQAGPASLAMARLRVDARQPEAAAPAFEIVAREYPTTSGEPLDTVLAEWGWALIDAQKPVEADAAFTRLLRDFPESPRAADARYHLAVSAFSARDFDRVLNLIQPITGDGSAARTPLTRSALNLQGRTLAEKGDWTGASAIFGRLIADDPDGAFGREARFWKAEVAFKSGDARAAETEFAAIAAEPPRETDFPGLLETARARRVQALAQLARWQDTLTAALEFQAGHPSDRLTPEVAYSQARAYQGLARFDEAREGYDRVIAARKGSEIAARAQFMRGETYFYQNQYRDALRDYYRVILQYNAPEWQAAARLEAGKVHEKLDQWLDAVECYEKLRAKYPQDKNAEEAGRRLEAARKRVPRTDATAAAPPG